MSTKRPGFSRVDTDANGVPLNNLHDEEAGPSSASIKKDWRDDDAASIKHGATAKVSGIDHPGLPAYFDEEAENKFGQADVVHTVCIEISPSDGKCH